MITRHSRKTLVNKPIKGKLNTDFGSASYVTHSTTQPPTIYRTPQRLSEFNVRGAARHQIEIEIQFKVLA